jgi:hypothetical protein
MAGMASVPPPATPERLTLLLREAGVLERGDVVAVDVETPRDTLLSRIARLRLTYGPAAAGPSHVFCKSRRDDIDAQLQKFGRKEVDFYRLVAPATPAGLLPRCYEARVEPGGPWFLMLEDLTASHQVMGDWPLPPPPGPWHAVVAAHARFHAAWWDHERLGVSVGAFGDESGLLDRYLAGLPGELAAFADRLGDRLSPERRRIYERLPAAAPRMLDRYRRHRHLTLVHGDAHVWNAMLPRQPGSGDLRLIDWDGWRVDTATDDLAYMLAMHWFPDWRRRHERDSLARYHDTLVAHGVRGYPFEALWEDYRLSVLWRITTPMWQANHGLPPVVWWHHLDRIMAAVHDLGCLELLD